MEPLVTNRFPIFAAWCYVIARRLGYREDEAKSLALVRARLGAAAKAGNLGHGSKPPGHVPRASGDVPAPPERLNQIEFVGMRPYVAEERGELRGVMHAGARAQVASPHQHDSSVTARLGDAYPAVLQELEALAARLAAEELNRNGYRLWQRFAPMVRDAGGRESKPRFGQRGFFDPAKVAALAAELAEEHAKQAA